MLFPRAFSRVVCLAVAFTMTALMVPMAAQAAMVGTPAIIVERQGQIDRQELLNALDRSEVQAKLASLGVDPAQAKARVAALTDEEIAALNDRFSELPAGGIDALGFIALVFVVLLITDILGYTDIFPFVKKSAR